MTKIDGIVGGQPPLEPDKTGAAPKKGGPSFQAVLEKAAAGVEQVGPADPASEAADAMADIADVKPPVTDLKLSPLHTEGVMRAERTLELLGSYGELLGNESKSLKEVFVALSAMEDEVKELTGVLDQLDKDDQLYPILEGVAVTAMTESIKFNRGDYNPAA